MRANALEGDGTMTHTITMTDVALRLLVTILCVSFIGFDRERSGRSAGLRTHLIVAVGSCLITLVQLEMTEDIINWNMAHPDLQGLLTTDPTRIIAQVISGIGFLGAGSIIVNKNASVTGLTTAATLWTSAILGIAAGLGYFSLVFLATVIMLFILIVLNLVMTHKTFVLDLYFDTPRSHLKDLHQVLDQYNLKMKDLIISSSSNHYHYQIKVDGDRRKINTQEISQAIWEKVDHVISVTFV